MLSECKKKIKQALRMAVAFLADQLKFTAYHIIIF